VWRLRRHTKHALHLRSAKSVRRIVKCLYAILAFQNALLYFPYP
jgi:hypothetical protein